MTGADDHRVLALVTRIARGSVATFCCRVDRAVGGCRIEGRRCTVAGIGRIRWTADIGPRRVDRRHRGIRRSVNGLAIDFRCAAVGVRRAVGGAPVGRRIVAGVSNFDGNIERHGVARSVRPGIDRGTATRACLTHLRGIDLRVGRGPASCVRRARCAIIATPCHTECHTN